MNDKTFKIESIRFDQVDSLHIRTLLHYDN